MVHAVRNLNDPVIFMFADFVDDFYTAVINKCVFDFLTGVINVNNFTYIFYNVCTAS